MGVEISEEFWPNTPIRTVSGGRACSFGTKLSDLEDTEVSYSFDEADKECHTPKSDIFKPPLVCPPAPKKSRPVRRKQSPPSQSFFQVPDNLESTFLVLKKPS